jgi:FAD/FMN-containing dehydrogenase
MAHRDRRDQALGVSTDYAALLPDDVVAAFRERIRGEVIGRADAGYDAARRIWNGMIDQRPSLIVRCRGAADVVAAVNLARDRGVPLSVRGGGHNVSGNALCDGVVVDLSLMRDVRVDPDRQVVRVAGGALLGDVDREAQAFGLAVPMGVMSRTGVGGLALHGGIGFLMRRHGLTSDNLVGADVVTADGRLLVVDASRHADLFWALRGGGGNFGVVTSFEFQAYPVGPDVWMCLVFYPMAAATRVLGSLRTFMETAPDEISAVATLWTAPHEDPAPVEHRGAPVIAIAACFSGPVEQGAAALAPLREIDRPLFDLSGPMPFLAAQTLFDPDYPDGGRYYWKSTFLSRLDDEVAEVLAGHAATRPSSRSSVDLVVLGGAISRVAPDATAFATRDAPYVLAIEANWEDPADDAANVAWARAVFDDVQRFSSGGAYLNFPGFGEEGEMLVRASYAGNYDRLQHVKARYDPVNLFRHNLNIRAAG